MCSARRSGAACAGVALYGAQYPTAQLYGHTVCRFPAARGKLALTYDDGPNPAYTPRLLDLLDAYDAKATFFLIGRWAEREPGAGARGRRPRARDRQPHDTHPTMPLHGAARIREELRRCRGAVEAAGVTLSRSTERR